VDWQLVLVGLVVAVAVAYLGRRAWRTWRGLGSGCGGCKCSNSHPPATATPPQTHFIPVEQLNLRLRERR
jgi:hypothetical protein